MSRRKGRVIGQPRRDRTKPMTPDHPPTGAPVTEPNSPEGIYETLRTRPGDSMDFIVTRDVAKAEPGKTVSLEAMEELETAFRAFLLARVDYHWRQKPGQYRAVGPMSIKAEVRLTVDGVHIEPTEDERPWFVLGQRRPH